MIINDSVEIIGHSRNIKYYVSLGYNIIVGQSIIVKTTSLTPGSTFVIEVACDICNKYRKSQFREYYNCTNGLTDKYYCRKCNREKAKATNIKKYGVDNVMKVECVKKDLKNSLLAKYGVDHYSKTDEYKVKYKNTINEKYDVDNAFQSEEVKDKIKKVNIERYGSEYVLDNPEVKKLAKATLMKRYGVDSPLKSENIKADMCKSNKEKWGVTNTFQIKKSRENSKISSNIRYGTDYPIQSEIVKNNISRNRRKITIERYEDIGIEDSNVISYVNGFFICIHNSKSHEFSISRDLLYSRMYTKSSIICTVCNPIDNKISSHELKIKQILTDNNINFIESNKTILDGKELDIYIPDLKLAIEFNGVYWHSEKYKHKDYHLNKTLKCQVAGIQLLHIFEDDWLYKNDIILSIIFNKLKLISSEKIGARKCTIKDISNKEARIFLDNNHIQGACNSKYNIGLHFNDELVSLMTFGYRYTNSKKEFELIRFCNKINTNISGSASRLFKHFVSNNIEVNKIISYSDLSLFDGKMYENLGFVNTHTSNPNYFWVVNGMRRHRFNFNKKKLISEGFDADKTEVEIMWDRGYYRIWGCGQYRWEFLNK